MRELTSHRVNGCNENLRVTVEDEPGQGGACHCYYIAGPDFGTWIRFQNGPIKEVGTNGLTHESLLAILEDRLVGFQAGPYACNANAEALAHIQAAQATLKARTAERLARGVEGTHQL